MVGIEIFVRMQDDDRALIDRQCRVMEALIEQLKDYLAVKRKEDDREINGVVERWQKATGNYTEVEPTAGSA
jgi:hypothetical protein